MARQYKANREAFGAIRERNGRFQASYPGPDGTRYFGPGTFANRTDARAWLAGIHSDIARGTWISPKQVKAEAFGTYAEACIVRREATGALKPRTATEYRRQLAKGLASFADTRITDITVPQVKSWHATRMQAGKTAAAREVALLRSILTEAVEDGIIPSVPVPAKLTNVSAGQDHRPPTLGELAVLHEHVEPRYKLAVLIAAYGGLRISEWRALRRSDLSLVDGQYAVSVTRQAQYITGRGWDVGTPKSAAGVRIVWLSAGLTDQVAEHLANRVGQFPESLLFAPKGNSEFIHNSDFYKSWKPAQKAAGVFGQVREHDLRDFAGSHLLDSGASLIEVRDFLGHEDSRTTERHYINRVSDRGAQLANAMPTLPAPKPSNVTKLPLAN